MLARLLLLFTVLPPVELVLLLWLADATSWRFTLALVLVTGVVGAVLARWQGARCWLKVREQLARGQLPADALLDAPMILVAGALLITPGVLTDLAGFALLLPPVRARLKRALRARMQVHLYPGGGYPGGSAEQPHYDHDEIVGSKVIDVRADDDSPDGRGADARAAERGEPPAEDNPPDRPAG